MNQSTQQRREFDSLEMATYGNRLKKSLIRSDYRSIDCGWAVRSRSSCAYIVRISSTDSHASATVLSVVLPFHDRWLTTYLRLATDVFARRIVGWRVSASLRTDFVLDALEQAIYERCGTGIDDLVRHSDRGTQYVSMRYTDRLADVVSSKIVYPWPTDLGADSHVRLRATSTMLP